MVEEEGSNVVDQMRAGAELGVSEPGLDELWLGEFGLHGLGLRKLGLDWFGLDELRLRKLGLQELGLRKLGLDGFGLDELGLGGIGLHELGLRELGLGGFGLDELGSRELRLNGFWLDEIGLGELEARVGLVELGLDEPGPKLEAKNWRCCGRLIRIGPLDCRVGEVVDGIDFSVELDRLNLERVKDLAEVEVVPGSVVNLGPSVVVVVVVVVVVEVVVAAVSSNSEKVGKIVKGSNEEVVVASNWVVEGDSVVDEAVVDDVVKDGVKVVGEDSTGASLVTVKNVHAKAQSKKHSP